MKLKLNYFIYFAQNIKFAIAIYITRSTLMKIDSDSQSIHFWNSKHLMEFHVGCFLLISISFYFIFFELFIDYQFIKEIHINLCLHWTFKFSENAQYFFSKKKSKKSLFSYQFKMFVQILNHIKCSQFKGFQS